MIHLRKNTEIFNLLKPPKNPLSASFDSLKPSEFLFLSSISRRSFSLWSLFAAKSNVKPQERIQPLSDFFRSVISGSKRTDDPRSVFAAKSNVKPQERIQPLSDFFRSAISGSERTDDGAAGPTNSEVAVLKQRLRSLEEDLRRSNKGRDENGKTRIPTSDKPDPNEAIGAEVNLSELFTVANKEKVKPVKKTDFGYEDPMVYKELSSDMLMLSRHLYAGGYFKDVNFLPGNKFDLARFEMSYGREILKYAAVKFGEDHRDIAKWLSASDLKKVALFGCPSLGGRTARAAKHMRSFFKIEEVKVCEKCVLKKSCNVARKGCKKNYGQLDLSKVIRVLIMYAMESVPEQLVVPEEVKASVSRLLKEIINLTS